MRIMHDAVAARALVFCPQLPVSVAARLSARCSNKKSGTTGVGNETEARVKVKHRYVVGLVGRICHPNAVENSG